METSYHKTQCFSIPKKLYIAGVVWYNTALEVLTDDFTLYNDFNRYVRRDTRTEQGPFA